MKKFTLVLFLTITFIFSGCANIFNGVVLPNQCKKCELYNAYTNEKIWEIEGCGSENTRLEEKVKEKAWELSRGKSLCDFEYNCKTWKQKKDQP